MRKDFSPVLKQALQQALEYLNNVDDQPVGATASLSEMRANVCKAWNTDGMDAQQVIADLVRDTAGGLNNSVNARFYAWVIGGSLPSALAADWLTSTWDQNAGMYSVAPAAAVVEEAVGIWLKDLFGLPANTSFALVTGCQMANTTCLAAARSWLLNQIRMGRGAPRAGRLSTHYRLLRHTSRLYRSIAPPAWLRRRLTQAAAHKPVWSVEFGGTRTRVAGIRWPSRARTAPGG
jgi:hypothetical protein